MTDSRLSIIAALSVTAYAVPGLVERGTLVSAPARKLSPSTSTINLGTFRNLFILHPASEPCQHFGDDNLDDDLEHVDVLLLETDARENRVDESLNLERPEHDRERRPKRFRE